MFRAWWRNLRQKFHLTKRSSRRLETGRRNDYRRLQETIDLSDFLSCKKLSWLLQSGGRGAWLSLSVDASDPKDLCLIARCRKWGCGLEEEWCCRWAPWWSVVKRWLKNITLKKHGIRPFMTVVLWKGDEWGSSICSDSFISLHTHLSMLLHVPLIRLNSLYFISLVITNQLWKIPAKKKHSSDLNINMLSFPDNLNSAKCSSICLKFSVCLGVL